MIAILPTPEYLHGEIDFGAGKKGESIHQPTSSAVAMQKTLMPNPLPKSVSCSPEVAVMPTEFSPRPVNSPMARRIWGM